MKNMKHGLTGSGQIDAWCVKVKHLSSKDSTKGGSEADLNHIAIVRSAASNSMAQIKKITFVTCII